MNDQGAPSPNRWNIPVQNQLSEQAPAHAALQVANSSAVGGDTVYNVTKPTGVAGAKIVLNSPAPLLANSQGAATDQYPTDALITGTPTFGQEIGPVIGSWALSVSGKGFMFLGGLAGGVGRVAAKGTTDDFPLVRILNVSGLLRSFGNIVGYGVSLDPAAPVSRIPTFQSAPPTAGKPFVVLLGNVANNDVVDAAPIGVAPVQINYTDIAHTHAEAISNDYAKLASAKSGPATILWRELQHIAGGGTFGIQWARVRLDPVAMVEAPRAVIYSIISKATGFRDQAITPGKGLVKMYLPPEGVIGTPWQIGGSPIEVETWMHSQSDVGKPVLLRQSRKAPDGSIIYEAISEGCAVVPVQSG